MNRTYDIGGIQKFSTSDGPGIRTSIFVKGCPLRCRWCHNPELTESRNQIIYSINRCIGCGACVDNCPRHIITRGNDGITIDREQCDLCRICVDNCYTKALRMSAEPMTIEEMMRVILQDKEFYEKSGGGVTLSGGEILSHPEFAVRISKECKRYGIPYVIDTSGYGDCQTLIALAEDAQMILYDMKCIDNNIHMEYTGKSNRLILDNLIKLTSIPDICSKIQMRMPMISGVNDMDEIIIKTAEFYKQYGLSEVMLIPYHDLGNAKRRGLGEKEYRFVPPRHERIEWMKEIFRQYGMKVYVTGENI